MNIWFLRKMDVNKKTSWITNLEWFFAGSLVLGTCFWFLVPGSWLSECHYVSQSLSLSSRLRRSSRSSLVPC
jgi:hypothetical protein